MSDDARRTMFAYYDERAPEYELFYGGGGPASVADPEAYVRESGILAALVREQVGAEHVDVACGTGYWLAAYHDRCEGITLVDQSAAMLGECEVKIARLGIGGKARTVQADVLRCDFPPSAFDSALVGFLLSHLAPEEEATLFAALRRALRPAGRFILFDSAWSPQRSASRPKESLQTRTLRNGRAFAIPKRYYETEDFARMAERHAASIRVLHAGAVFIAAVGAPR